MCDLPCDDHRRKAWLATSQNEFAGSLFDRPEVLFTAKRWRVALVIFYGLPVGELAQHAGRHIKAGGSGNPTVDAHGHALLSLSHSLGGGTPTHHNNMTRVVFQSPGQAGVKTRSTGLNGGVKNIFKGSLSGGSPLGEHGNNKIN